VSAIIAGKIFLAVFPAAVRPVDTGKHAGQCPKIDFVPANCCVPKNCFKHAMKTNLSPLKCILPPKP